MKKEGPVLANLLLTGIYPESMQMPETTEPGVQRAMRDVFPARGKVLVDGKPLLDGQISFHELNAKVAKPVRIDALVEPDGTFALATYEGRDGAPEGEYAVTTSNEFALVATKVAPCMMTWLRPLWNCWSW